MRELGVGEQTQLPQLVVLCLVKGWEATTADILDIFEECSIVKSAKQQI